MDVAASAAVLGRPPLISAGKHRHLVPARFRTGGAWRPSLCLWHSSRRSSSNGRNLFWFGSSPGCGSFWSFGRKVRFKETAAKDWAPDLENGLVQVPRRRRVVFVIVACGILGIACRGALAVEGARLFGRSGGLVKGVWSEWLQVLALLRERGLVLAAFVCFSAFFSMAETSIAMLWPWMVHELAEEESGDGVFTMLNKDVTRFLATILIGTTAVNIGATALITEAAAMVFGEAGMCAAIAVTSVSLLLLTEITPRRIAANNPVGIARAMVRPVAWFSLIIYPLGRVLIFLSMGFLQILGLESRSDPYVTKEKMKLIVGGVELRPIEEEEQDMIENVLEIKDTDVKEVMTPLVDVVAIDASAALIDLHNLLATHQYSRVPVFEDRVDNIVGIVYATDMLEHVEGVDQLLNSSVGDIARKPAYFVIESMSVSILLAEFSIRKVHMAVVLNEYGGTIGIVTVEDVVEEIVGEIFDENDSKERIQKQTGYVVKRADGVYDVGANTSIDRLSEELHIKLPEDHEYETVSGFICETFGYIPRPGETVEVLLENANFEANGEFAESQIDKQDKLETRQLFKLEVLAGNARRVSAIRLERVEQENEKMEIKDVAGLARKDVDQTPLDSNKPNCVENSLGDDYFEYHINLKHVEDQDNIFKN